MCVYDEDGRQDGAFPWMEERRALFRLYNHGGLGRARAQTGRVPLSRARAYVRAYEAHPEIMQAWASAPPDGVIPDEDWDLITEFNAYLWVKSGASLEALDAVGGAARRLANREFDSAESEGLIDQLLRDPRIVDDRPRG